MFDAAGGRLGNASVISKQSHEGGVTALKPYAGKEGQQQSLLVTGGRDGMVRVWDARSRDGSAVLKIGTGGLFLSFIFTYYYYLFCAMLTHCS